MCNLSLVTIKALKQNLDCIFNDLHSKAFCSQWNSSYLNLFLKLSILSLMNKKFSVFTWVFLCVRLCNSAFKTESRGFHLLLSFIIVLFNLLLQWCLSNVFNNAAKINPFVCYPLLQLFSIFKCNTCYIQFWVPFHADMFEGEEDGIITH